MLARHYLLLSFGIAVTVLLPIDPTPLIIGLIISILVIILLLIKLNRYKRQWEINILIAGLIIGLLQQAWLYQRLLPVVYDNTQAVIEGTIHSLITRKQNLQKFELQVESIASITGKNLIPLNDYFPIKPTYRLSWYKNKKTDIETWQALNPGQKIKVTAKIKRPRGFVNPDLFDYENWLIGVGINATGSIKSLTITSQDPSTIMGYLHRWRSQISQNIFSTKSNEGADIFNVTNNFNLKKANTVDINSISTARSIAAALSVGDKRYIPHTTTDLFIASGIIHLMVISGLHIGLISLLCYGLGILLASPLSLLLRSFNTRHLAWGFAWLGATTYSLISGLSIATVRALIMLSVLVAARLMMRRIRPLILFSISLALVLLVQPLSVLQRGFWLSFGAVAVLMLFFYSRSTDFSSNKPFTRWSISLLKTQWALLLGYSLVLIVSVGQLNLLSPLINLIAVPFISFIIIPLMMMALILSAIQEPIITNLTNDLWLLHDWLVNHMLQLLINIKPFWYLLYFPPLPWTLIASIAAASLLLLMPVTLPLRHWALCAFLPLALTTFNNSNTNINGANKSPLQVTLLDVGQGLAIVIESFAINKANNKSENYVLVYDTGRRFSRSFDVGADIIAPYLQQRGIKNIDHLVISHSDNDHAGGVSGLLEHIKVNQIFYGSSLKQLPVLSHQSSQNKITEPIQSCHQGVSWQWHHLQFKFLAPIPNLDTESNNDQSCVLLITYKDQKLLFTGDISSLVESQLLTSETQNLQLLIAPHHGSKTSSSAALLTHSKPDVILISSGYKNQFHHPHPSIMKRYAKFAPNSQVFNTAYQGAIQVQWRHEENRLFYRLRHWREQRFYWWNW